MGHASIIAVGSEMLLGIRVDTNSSEIARALIERGFTVDGIDVVGDHLESVVSAVRRAARTSDVVFVGGGLGPTHDDVTRTAVAAALDLDLVRSPELVQMLQRFSFAPNDPDSTFYTQADLVAGAEAILPVAGTAPGQVIPGPVGDVVLLPGPPAEMRPLLAIYLERHPVRVGATREITVVGLSESDVMDRILDLVGPDMDLTLLASARSVQVVLFEAGDAGLIDGAAERVIEVLGEHVASEIGESLAATVIELARARGVTIGTVESCTGGMVAAAITDVAGASDVFVGGAVTYSNKLKSALVDVDEALMVAHGAVSSEVAAAMAEGGAVQLGCDLAVSVTGIAGPEGGTPDKPVGTVWFGVRFRGATYTELVRFHGTREVVRLRSVTKALDLSRRALLGIL